MAGPRSKAWPFRQPRHPAEIWLHVDEFTNPHRRIWAVQYLSPRSGNLIYRTAAHVILEGPPGITRFWSTPQQPRAVLVFKGRVRWPSRYIASIEAC